MYRSFGPNFGSLKVMAGLARLIMIVALLCALAPMAAAAPDATLLAVSFNSDTNGFVYVDDAFGTSRSAYASGVRTASGGYGGSGGLQVTLGGVDATVVTNGMSGGWSYTLNLAAAESGVKLSFRYLLSQTATYEFDEYSRVLVKVDGVQYGRGAKSYVDHIGGDGSSTQGNSSTYLPTTAWQQVEIYLGDLAAGSHTIVLGGFNNKKDASDETTTVVIDDVVLTSGNPAPAATAAEILADRVDINQFLAYNQGVAQFDDRCSASNISCSTVGNTTNYMNALAWVEAQLQALGYTTVRHAFNYNGNTGTNLWATKVGSVTPTQMYMVSAHLDARSGGDGFDDDGSGVALVMEVARVLAGADVTTDKSVRFLFWDKEEVGLYGAYGYVQDRRLLQGTLNEPTWLGLIQHDMILYDHGAGTRTTAQSAYADMDVEWRAGTAQATASQALALQWAHVSGRYAPDYPATAYNYSTNTDDTPFHPYVASVSVRENRRSLTSGGNAEWINPYYHTTSDIESSYTRDDDGDGKRDDIELGYNTVRTTLGLVAELAGAHVVTPNAAPVATPQSVSTAEDTQLSITLSGSDPDGDLLAYSISSGPAHGALSGAAPNVIYTPNADFNGTDSFTFTVNDGQATSAPATISISVTPVNDAPVANPQSVTTDRDSAVAITLTGSDVDGDALAFSITGGPSNGSLAGVAPNLTYTPAPGYSGPDSFAFTVSDGTAVSSPASVSITVLTVNQPPVANSQSVTTDEDTPVVITLTGSDPDGNPLTFAVATQPLYGELNGSAPDLTYTPSGNYHGEDSFTFTVNDGQLTSAPATVSITINPVNDAPLANPQSATTERDTPVAVVLSGSDVDGDALAFEVVATPSYGTLSGAAPALTYTPNAGYIGADSFTFTVSDGQATSAPATVDLTVTAVNQPPVASGQAVTTAEDTAVAITLTGSDPDDDPLTYSLMSTPVHGVLSGAAPNLTYTPAANYNGPDSFQFSVYDGALYSEPATVSVTVNPVNDLPAANGLSVTTQQDTAVAITLSGSDADGDPLTFSVATQPANGALSGVAPNLTYTPSAGYSGADSFTFTVGDGQASSAPATVNITVTPSGPRLYLGSSTSGTAGSVSFADEDILIKDMGTGAWTMFFDGSDVGLANTDVDAFELLADGSLLMSFDTDFTLTNFGAVDDSDILRFVPTSTGAATTGAWQWYFDGSDVGLSTSDEDVDAFALLPDGRLLISTLGSVSVSGASGADEDLLLFTPAQLGATTSGAWTLYFDGSDVGLASSSSEDVNGVWVDAAGKIYLTTLGSFSVTGVSGDGSDIFVCTPTSLGSTTQCSFSMYWDGSANGFSGEVTDSIGIDP